MSIFDEMDDPAQVRAHLGHWRAELTDPSRAGDFLHIHQAKQIVARLERKLVEIEEGPPPPRDVVAEQAAERAAYYVMERTPKMRSESVTVHPDGSWTMTFVPKEASA